MTTLAKNQAESSPYLKLHIKLLEARFRTAKGSLEMLTVFKFINTAQLFRRVGDKLMAYANLDLNYSLKYKSLYFYQQFKISDRSEILKNSSESS
jgi:hypothetical protein